MAYIGKAPTPVPLNSSDIIDGTIVTADIANDAITSAKIADDAITAAKIASLTATIDELNYLDITTLGTSEASKVVTADSSGNVVLAGNLTVSGTTTTVNSTTLDVADLNVTVASGAANATAANGAGLTVDCGSDTNATFIYTSSTDTWDFNKPITGTYENLHPEVSTITTAIDMNKPFMSVTLSAATTFTATNLAEGRVSILKFKPASYTPTWPTEINWADATEPTWANYNTWVISLVCDSGTDILASATGHTV